jgi:hypothetical protein
MNPSPLDLSGRTARVTGSGTGASAMSSWMTRQTLAIDGGAGPVIAAAAREIPR